MSAQKPLGVVLLQLGGPDSLDSVEPFLVNLFSDPDIIDLPLAFLFRRRLARLIARTRAPKVQKYYRRIGGRSPILKLTLRQASALERALLPRLNVRVVIAMRYWHPMTDTAIAQLAAAGVERVILLPLYPQYSKTTTGSSVNEWGRVIARRGATHMRTELVEQYADHPRFVAALVRNITIALNRVPESERSHVHLVFSAHGTPLKLVRDGDPYQPQIVRTYAAVLKAGNFGLRHHLCYQSKVGPQKWLEPSLDQTIERLAHENVSHVIVVPIAFVSDHSETLWEINIEGRAEARARGIRYFDMSPALHTNPYFIDALADLVLRKAAG
ncbi:MAG: ferrochelatase [Bacteroidota bacterium]